MRRSAVLVALVLALAPAERAQADAGEEGDALIKQGLLLRRQGKDVEALDVFRRAYAQRPTPRGRAQVALAEQALGRWVEAEADLVQALAARDDAWVAANRGLLESGLGAIRGHLGWLMVTADVSAELWVNDARVGSLPLAQPIRVEAGSAVLEVRAAGFAPVRRLAAIEPGGSAREAVHMVPLVTEGTKTGEVVGLRGAGLAEPVIVRVPPNLPMRNAAFVALGAGVLGLAAGSYFGVRTFDAKNQRDMYCSSAGCTTELGVALDHEARSLALASTAWFIAGGLAAGSGGALLWMARARTVRGPPAVASSLRFVPVIGPDRAGVGVGGSW